MPSRASASITGCVRKTLLRLRPSAYLTRDHRLGAALSPATTQEHRFYSTTTSQPYFGSNTRTTRFRLNHPTFLIRQIQPILKNNSTSTKILAQDRPFRVLCRRSAAHRPRKDRVAASRSSFQRQALRRAGRRAAKSRPWGKIKLHLGELLQEGVSD